MPWWRVAVAFCLFNIVGELFRQGSAYTGCTSVCQYSRFIQKCYPHDYEVDFFRTHDHMPGDVEFITFLPLHRVAHAENGGQLKCTDFDGVRAVERVEAVRVATKHINHLGILGGFSVGADVYDSCDSGQVVQYSSVRPMLASYSHSCSPQEQCSSFKSFDPISSYLKTEQAASGVDDEDSGEGSGVFIPPTLSPAVRDRYCQVQPSDSELRPAGVRPFIIGPSSSEIALTTTAFFGSFQFVHLSYGADSTQLSKQDQYPYFFRTVPVADFQAKAIAALLQSLAIGHFAVLASGDDYGSSVFEVFLALLRKNPSSPCAAVSGIFESEDEEGITTFLSNVKKVQLKTIVLIASGDYAINFLRKAAEERMTGYTWIGTNRWTSSPKLRSDQDIIDVLGNRVLSISPAPPRDSYVSKNWARIKKHLEHRLHRLAPSPRHLGHNPWLKKAWEETFGCKITKELSLSEARNEYSSPVRNSYACRMLRDLKTKEQIEERSQTLCNEGMSFVGALREPSELRFLIHTFFVAAQAVRHMLDTSCKGQDASKPSFICPILNASDHESEHKKMKHVDVRSSLGCQLHFQEIQETLRQANLTGNDSKQVAFSIAHLNFQTDETDPSSFREIGVWSPEDRLHWTNKSYSAVNFFSPDLLPFCSPTQCGAGKEKFYPQTRLTHKCCFQCRSCIGNKIKPPNSTAMCKQCKPGFWPNKDHSRCEPIIASYHTTWTLTWSLIIVCFALLVGISAILGMVLNIKYKSKIENLKHNLVVLSFHAVGSFVKALLLAHPSKDVCILQILLLWPWPVAVTATFLLIKTNHLRKLSAGTKTPVGQRLVLSVGGEVLLWVGLGAGTLLEIILWLAISTPNKEMTYSSEGTAEIRCSTSTDWTIAYYTITLFFLTAATASAFQTRKIESHLNQSKYIFVASFFATLLWIFFLPATYILEKLHPSMLLAVITLLQDVVIQVCIFARPIYYVFFEFADVFNVFGQGIEMNSMHKATSQASTGPASEGAQFSSDMATSEGPRPAVSKHPTLYLDADLKEPCNTEDDLCKIEEAEKIFDEIEFKAPFFDSGVPPEDTDNLELVMFNGPSPRPSNL